MSARVVGTQYITSALSGTPNVSTTYTVMCWARWFTSGGGTRRCVFSVGANAANAQDAFYSDGTALGQIDVNGAATSSGVTPISSNFWYHVAMVRESPTRLVGYVNGNPEMLLTTSVAGRGAGNRSYFGASESGEHLVDGAFEHCRIWTVALKADEVQAEMRADRAARQSGLVFQLPCTQFTTTNMASQAPPQNFSYAAVGSIKKGESSPVALWGDPVRSAWDRIRFALAGAPAPIAVPNVVGETQAQATTDLTNAGLAVNTSTDNSGSVAAGLVISQSPIAGSSVAAGTTVLIVISLGAIAVAEQPAGRARSRPRREVYLVKVDDQDFEFSKLEAAIEFLQKTRVAAEELAAREIEAAIAKQAKARERISPPKLTLPKITASSRDLRPAITQAKRDIAAAYERSARDAEIAIYFTIAKRKEQEEDEEILVFLF